MSLTNEERQTLVQRELQYKEYTREATGNKAERSAQLLGGEFLDEPSGKAERWYE